VAGPPVVYVSVNGGRDAEGGVLRHLSDGRQANILIRHGRRAIDTTQLSPPHPHLTSSSSSRKTGLILQHDRIISSVGSTL
jgi:hypothetical protein